MTQRPQSSKPAQIITVANQKGGVGKTTTVANLGVGLGALGLRVLLVDNDPQANLTAHFGIIPGQGLAETSRTLDEIYLSKKLNAHAEWEEFVVSIPIDLKSQDAYQLDLITSDSNLAGVEFYLFSRNERERVLQKFLDALVFEYDVILIDNPPSLNLLTLNSLVASKWVLIPVQPEFFGLEGIAKIRETIEDVRGRWNEDLEILGAVATQVSDRRKLTGEMLGTLEKDIGSLLLKTRIRENSAIAESSGKKKSVIEHRRSSHGAEDYLGLAKEIQARL